jgi:hypothetical protein
MPFILILNRKTTSFVKRTKPDDHLHQEIREHFPAPQVYAITQGCILTAAVSHGYFQYARLHSGKAIAHPPNIKFSLSVLD